MDRRILLQVTAPTVVIGLVLLGTCLVSAWIVNRLQTSMARFLSQNVISLDAAQELEVNVHKLRFSYFRYLADPERARLDDSLKAEMADSRREFKSALQLAKNSVTTPEERDCLAQIESGYQEYRREFDRLRQQAVGPWRDFARLADEGPIHLVLDPCDQFTKINRAQMHQNQQESEQVSRVLRLALVLLGVGGPASGLILGYGMARALSRSIAQLRVHVHDMARCLDVDVDVVKFEPDGDMQQLDRSLAHVIDRVREVTEQLQKHQQEMLRAQQLAAVGTLASGIAHEIRNPLMSIKLLVEAALTPHNPRPFTAENLRIVHSQVVRLEKTVQGFLDFARPPALQRRETDLRTVVEEALALISARARQQGVTVDLSPSDSPPVCSVDRGQLGTVAVNLLLNALDAMPQGGRLQVRLTHDARWATLSVIDSGSGIAPEMKSRLFTPFASTKATGTGLGLSLARRVVEEHGGSITGGNHASGGACFTVRLPILSG